MKTVSSAQSRPKLVGKSRSASAESKRSWQRLKGKRKLGRKPKMQNGSDNLQKTLLKSSLKFLEMLRMLRIDSLSRRKERSKWSKHRLFQRRQSQRMMVTCYLT